MSGEHPYVSHQVAATSHYSLQASPTSGLHPIATGGPQHPGVSAPPFAFREDLPGNYGGHPLGSETMNGVAGPPHPHPHHHQYPYHEHMEQVPRGPPSNAGPPHWQPPYYGNQVPLQGPDHEHGNRMMQEAPPYSPHTTQHPNWDKPRTSFSRPPPGQDPNFTHPHNIPTSQKYVQPFARPPHHQPVEPTAAPSPPTQYPGSPRTPLPHQPPNPLNGQQSFGQPNSHRSSLSMATGPETRDIRQYSDAHQPSPLRSPLDPPPTPRHMNGSRSGSVGHAFGPTNGHGGFGSGGNPYSHRQSQGSWDSHAHSADEAIPDNRNNGMGRKYAGSDDGDRVVKREATSRSVSESMSPSNRRMTLGNTNDQGPSDTSIKSENSTDPPPKKRGVVVFHDENGNEYCENEYVPPGVRIPSGWQRGTGKLTQDLLLPLAKDGIAVNAEWGFTAGGKARQRLPQACVNCRQKKIKCVETEYDELQCQHCTKMRIQCERSTKEEEKKKGKKIKSEHGPRSSSLASDDGKDLMGRNGSKKRKSSVDISQDYKRQNRQMGSRGGSRGGSMTRDPVNTTLANQMRHPPPPSSARTDSSRPDGRAPMFPTMEPHCIAVEPPEDSSTKAQYTHELRENQFGPSGSSTHTLSDSSPRSYHATPAPSPTTPISNSGVVLHNPTFNDVASRSHYSTSGSSSKETEGRSRSTPTTPPIMFTIGEDSRHLDLPGPEMLKDLVDSYFRNVYSQTYAFLHRRTFEQDISKHPPVLLFSICAVAARFTQHRELEEKFAIRARDLIINQYDSYTIEVVQSMVNMGLHDFGSNNGQKAWMFCGMAVRMGAAMNMNLEIDKRNKVSRGTKGVIAREVMRRTYWSYFLMDRFNNYGVARPYLIQDHDCHIQLPCNQPCFNNGTPVSTEYLLSPNPRNPEVGTEFMGAMAFLVRIVGIWGNILRQIHLSGLPRAEGYHNGLIPPGKEFDYFIDILEKWRRSLPRGLTYSNENLAGQIKVGTTGAFVMMHVMWHTAMAYVHRYVRTVGLPKEEIKKRIANGCIVESIRKAFVHADAVLQIMYHVRQKKNADPDNVTINAPFLGQAISDACHVTITRAVEVRGEPGGARDQKARVYVGLDWLKELKQWWKPVQQMHKDLKKRCQKFDITSSVPPSQRAHYNVAPTPESSTDSAVPSGYHYMGNEYMGDVPFASDEMNHSMDDYEVFPIPSFLGIGVPQGIYADAFGVGAQGTLFEYAGVEGAFPELYEPATTSFVPNVTAAGQLNMMSSMHETVVDQSFQSQNFSVTDQDLSDAEDGVGSPDKDGGERRDIHATYFDPVAVHDGKLQDSASDTTENHSRRASEVLNPKQSNPMDLFNLISMDVASDVQRTLPERHNDEFTGPGGAAAPESGDMGAGPMSLDNTEG